jgi:hypothetical protein
MNNYILNSNNDEIKDDEGRRYNTLDVNHKYKGNHTYFGNLRKNCFNDEVGKAFYSYLMEINIDGFIPQNYPITNSKLNSHIKRLDKVYEFIKNNYILRKLDLNITTKDLYKQYEGYCIMHNIKVCDKTTFHKEKLERIGISYKKTMGNTVYKYSWNDLNTLAIKLKWLDELDDNYGDNDDEDFNQIQLKNKEIEDLQNQIIELNKTIETMKKTYFKPKQEAKIKEPIFEKPTTDRREVLIIDRILKKSIDKQEIEIFNDLLK